MRWALRTAAADIDQNLRSPDLPVQSTSTPDLGAMLDPAALEPAHMSPALDKPLTDTDEDETIYGCENVLSEVMLEIHAHPNAIGARLAADLATHIPDPGYSNPFPNAVRLPYGDPMGGAKIIATETGGSRFSWSHDAYWVLLEINSTQSFLASSGATR